MGSGVFSFKINFGLSSGWDPSSLFIIFQIEILLQVFEQSLLLFFKGFFCGFHSPDHRWLLDRAHRRRALRTGFFSRLFSCPFQKMLYFPTRGKFHKNYISTFLHFHIFNFFISGKVAYSKATFPYVNQGQITQNLHWCKNVARCGNVEMWKCRHVIFV